MSKDNIIAAQAFLRDLSIQELRINQDFIANKPVLDFAIILRSQLSKQDPGAAYLALRSKFPNLMKLCTDGNILELFHDVALGLLDLGADPLLEFDIPDAGIFTPFGDALGRDWRLVEAMTASAQFDATYTYPRTNPEAIPAFKHYTTFETIMLAMIAEKDAATKKGEVFEIPKTVLNCLSNILNKNPDFILSHRCLKSKDSDIKTGEDSPIDIAVKHLPEVLDMLLEADEDGKWINIPHPYDMVSTFIKALGAGNIDTALKIAAHKNFPAEFFQRHPKYNLPLVLALEKMDFPYIMKLLEVHLKLQAGIDDNLPAFITCINRYNELKISNPTEASNIIDIAKRVVMLTTISDSNHEGQDVICNYAPLVLLFAFDIKDDEFLKTLLELKPTLANEKIDGKTAFGCAIESGCFASAYSIAKSPTFADPEAYVGSDGCNLPILLSTIFNDLDLFKSLISKNPGLVHHSIDGIPQFDYLGHFLSNNNQEFVHALLEIIPGIDISETLKTAIDSGNVELLHKVLEIKPDAVTLQVHSKSLIGYAESIVLSHLKKADAEETKEKIKHVIGELIFHKAEITEQATELAKTIELDLAEIGSHANEWHVDLIAQMMAKTTLVEGGE